MMISLIGAIMCSFGRDLRINEVAPVLVEEVEDLEGRLLVTGTHGALPGITKVHCS